MFRVVSYNVRSLRDDKAALSRIIRDLDPDVVLVQEAPKYLLWRNKAASFARQCHMLYVGGGRPTGGTAMLTPIRVDVRDVRELALSKTPSLAQRGVVVARLAKAGVEVVAASIHLGLDAAERARHLTEITGALEEYKDGVTIVGGDFNERPDAPTWSRLAAEFVDMGAKNTEPTFSAQRPRRRIDGIFVRGPATVDAYEVLDSADVEMASDHRPVVADLTLS